MKTIEFKNIMGELELYISTDIVNDWLTIGYKGFQIAKISKKDRFFITIDFFGFRKLPVEIQEDVYKALTLYAQTPIGER